MLSPSLLNDLRAYFVEYKPKEFLIEGQRGGKYSEKSVAVRGKNGGTQGRYQEECYSACITT